VNASTDIADDNVFERADTRLQVCRRVRVSAHAGIHRELGRRWGACGRFAFVSVFTLALGIGATTFIFSVVEGTLLKPLPYPQPERIVALRHSAPGLHIDDMNLAASLYFTYKEESRVFNKCATCSSQIASCLF
jgi:hypothetical protein